MVMSTIINLILTLGVGGFIAYYSYKLGYSKGRIDVETDIINKKCDDVLERIEDIKKSGITYKK